MVVWGTLKRGCAAFFVFFLLFSLPLLAAEHGGGRLLPLKGGMRRRKRGRIRGIQT